MEWISNGFEDINFWLVALSSVIGMVIGMVWYGNGLFGESWRKEVGMKKKDMENMEGMGAMFARSFVLGFIASSVLFAILKLASASSWGDAVWIAIVLSVGFTFTAIAVNNIYQRRNMQLTFIDAGYQMASLIAAALVYNLWA